VPSKQHIIVGLGEILWDMLPGGKELGGAPANFAYMATRLGDSGIVASRVGTDELGQQTQLYLERLGLSPSHVQFDEARSTGTVLVRVNDRGQPAFTTIFGKSDWEESMRQPIAWEPG